MRRQSSGARQTDAGGNLIPGESMRRAKGTRSPTALRHVCNGGLALLAACYAGLDPAEAPEADGSTSAADPDDMPEPSGCEQSPGHVVARRLTRAEYDNTLRDLFRGFDVGSPADALPEDVEGAIGLTVSDYYLEKHEQVVTDLAALVVDDGFITCDPTPTRARARARSSSRS